MSTVYLRRLQLVLPTRGVVALLCGAAAMLPAVVVTAQTVAQTTADTGIEEVVVTATRRSESLQSPRSRARILRS